MEVLTAAKYVSQHYYLRNSMCPQPPPTNAPSVRPGESMLPMLHTLCENAPLVALILYQLISNQ